MSKTIKVKGSPNHFRARIGRNSVVHCYWDPSKTLRDLGFRTQSLIDDAGQPLIVEDAIEAAKKINQMVEAVKRGEAMPAEIPHQNIKALDTIDFWIDEFMKSDDWFELAEKTRKGYRTQLNQISLWIGDQKAASDKKSHEVEVEDVVAHYKILKRSKWATANAQIRVLRLLFGFARRALKYRGPNPASKINMKSTPPRLIKWEEEELEFFMKKADQLGWHSVGLAAMMGCFAGQREGDILALKDGLYRDGEFDFTQSKTGARVIVEAIPDLKAKLKIYRAKKRLEKVTATTLLAVDKGRAKGQPWKQYHFIKVVKLILDACVGEKQSMARLFFMDTRTTCVVWMGEQGCSDYVIASVTGHTIERTKQILEHYGIRTKALAKLGTDALALRWENRKKG